MTFYRIPWTGIETRRNVLPNPSGRVSLTGYGALGTDATLTLEPGVDTYALTTTAGIGPGNFGVHMRTLTIGTDLDPGTAYTYSMEGVGHISGVSQSWMLTVGGTGLPGFITQPHVGDWQRDSLTFTTLASGDVNVYVLNNFTTGAGVNVIAFRDANVEKSSTFDAAMPYFDGATPDTIERHYEWTGTADDSASRALIPSGDDLLDPTLGILVPHTVTREARSVVQLLAESADPSVTYIPPGPRSGVMSSVFLDPAAAFAAQAWFGTNHDYVYVNEEATYATMRFRVADGDIEVEQTDAGTLLRIPFVEVAGATG